MERVYFSDIPPGSGVATRSEDSFLYVRPERVYRIHNNNIPLVVRFLNSNKRPIQIHIPFSMQMKDRNGKYFKETPHTSIHVDFCLHIV